MRFVSCSTSGDPDERHKTAVAEKLLEGTDLALSVQVLQELYVQGHPTDERGSHLPQGGTGAN